MLPCLAKVSTGVYSGATASFSGADWLCLALIAVGCCAAVLFVRLLRRGGPVCLNPSGWVGPPPNTPTSPAGYRHPATDRFCLWCGADKRKKEPYNQRTSHDGPPRFCNLCGAGSGEPCDAGLHS